LGVAAAVNGFLSMHILVIHSDWDMRRLTWHPSMICDSLLMVCAGLSVIVFAVTFILLSNIDHWTYWTEYETLINVSVVAEWVLLVILMIMQLNLPARAVRIALHVAESDTSLKKGF
jgi:ABC-type Fe3+ transport system permease subunit